MGIILRMQSIKKEDYGVGVVVILDIKMIS